MDWGGGEGLGVGGGCLLRLTVKHQGRRRRRAAQNTLRAAGSSRDWRPLGGGAGPRRGSRLPRLRRLAREAASCEHPAARADRPWPSLQMGNPSRAPRLERELCRHDEGEGGQALGPRRQPAHPGDRGVQHAGLGGGRCREGGGGAARVGGLAGWLMARRRLHCFRPPYSPPYLAGMATSQAALLPATRLQVVADARQRPVAVHRHVHHLRARAHKGARGPTASPVAHPPALGTRPARWRDPNSATPASCAPPDPPNPTSTWSSKAACHSRKKL
jgi:hypothetical protein